MSMNRLGLASAALAVVACLAAPAAAGDFYRGSVKDAPALMHAAAGPCYLRGDVGYSWSGDPESKFTQTSGGLFVTDAVSASLDNTWLVGVGVGCGSGPRGLRGEIMLDFRGDRDLGGTVAAPQGGTLATSVKTTTVMFNAYYDLGRWGNATPYVGAGVGFAHNTVDDVSFSALFNRIEGDEKWALAWSLMAGVGYQLSERAVLDFGYRYIDMGKATSGTRDSAGFTNPAVRFDDLVAHEFKIGLRFALGGGAAPMAMK